MKQIIILALLASLGAGVAFAQLNNGQSIGNPGLSNGGSGSAPPPTGTSQTIPLGMP